MKTGYIFLRSNEWAFHPGELPEKPCTCHPMCKWPFQEDGNCRQRSGIGKKEYKKAIAAIKKNALTIGNWSIIDASDFVEKGGLKPDEFYEWCGGYETKEIQDKVKVTDGKASYEPIKTVAMLTLPKEKHHGFCENPESKCTMNYCDENGCIERKRNLVGADLVPPSKKITPERAKEIEGGMNNWRGKEDEHEKIAQILRDNITFSGQVGDYVIHGAINKIIEHFSDQLAKQEVAFRETVKDLKNHSEWIYWRMVDIHNEKENVDYMIKFRNLIDSLSAKTEKE